MMLFQASTPARGSTASLLWRPCSRSRSLSVDTVTTLDIAVAVLYVAVVLLALDFTAFGGSWQLPQAACC